MPSNDSWNTIRGAVLYAIPVVGACLPLFIVDQLSPSGHPDVIAKIATSDVNFGADAAAAIYYVSISYAVTVVVAFGAIWCFAQWLRCTGLPEATPQERRWIWLGIGIAIAIPVLFLVWHGAPSSVSHEASSICTKINDCLTKKLFEHTIYRTGIATSFAMRHDVNVMAALVFMAFLLAVTAVSTSTGTCKAITAREPNASEEVLKQSANERMSVVNMALFLMAALLVSAIVTAKFRFDIGLATLPPSPKGEISAAIKAYHSLSSAIMTYWASILSLSLALIYLPSAYLLTLRPMAAGLGGLPRFFELNRESGLRLLKLAAIISPPIVNQLIETLAKA
jgi:hypothetical protein